MSEFKCGSFNYRAGVIDARAQFHIVRRLAPFLTALLPVLRKFGEMKAAGKKASDISQEEMLEIVPGLGGALSDMDDETADYVIFGLLAVVTRDQGNGLGWAPVSIGRSINYMDINMPQMITLAGRSLMANLGDFFVVLNSISSQQGQNPNGQ